MRRLAKRAVEAFREGAEAVFFFAPTGYGKTEAAPYAWKATGMPRAIHVAPMRTLVSAIYEKWKKHATSIDLDVSLVGQQQMGEVEGKSPYFLKKAVATTFDSYIHNLFKLPPAARGVLHAYYELPRFAISTAFHVFDEAHLYGGDAGAGDVQMFTAFLVAIRSVARRGLPVFVITATMPPKVSEALIKNVDNHYRKIEVIDFEERNDPEFTTPKYITHIVDHWRDVRIEARKRYLYVFNTVERAVEAYLELKRTTSAVLIHGRFTAGDRRKKEEAIYQSKVVVATQVVEVGVDLDVDVLVTDAAPITSMVQRAGRVCRFGIRDSCEVYVVRGDGAGVYDRDVVETSLKVLDKSFDWKRPRQAIEEVYKGRPLSLDYSIYADLWRLDADAYASYDDAKKLAEKYCGIARDAVLVQVYVSQPSPDHAVPVSFNIIEKLTRHVRGVVERGKVKPVKKLDCTDLILGRIDGVLIDSTLYDSELGLWLGRGKAKN